MTQAKGNYRLQELYRKHEGAVRASGLNEETAARRYRNYIQFVTQFAPSGGSILDAGCGVGWSSYLLSRESYQVTGLDLNGSAFEPPTSAQLSFVEGSVLELPFASGVFDIVAINEALEHVPDPRRALEEMIRVLKPGGVLCLVGPNLLSLGLRARALVFYVWRTRPIAAIFWRSPGMPKHPCGNTLPEVLWSFPSALGSILVKLLTLEARFTMREPDLNLPFHADNDACYLCNPIDLCKFLSSQGFAIARNGAPGRPTWTRLLASGTYIAARKPE